MEVTTIPYTKDFDSRAVDAARCSFKKSHENYTEEQNSKLIKYLIKHKHLSPFFHSHLTFLVDASWGDLNDVILNKRLMAGLNISNAGKSKMISGSVWALLELSRYLSGVTCLLTDYAPITVAWFEDIYDWDLEWVNPVIEIGPEIIAKGNESLKHTYKTLHIKSPIFVERQMIKHQLDFGFSFPLELARNEVSKRYVSDDPEFYAPDNWRKYSKDKKQGSCEDEYITLDTTIGDNNYDIILGNKYKESIISGVCPEQARMLLPQSMYTEYYLTGNMNAWNRLLTLREDPHAQKEIRDLAQMIREALDD